MQAAIDYREEIEQFTAEGMSLAETLEKLGLGTDYWQRARGIVRKLAARENAEYRRER